MSTSLKRLIFVLLGLPVLLLVVASIYMLGMEYVEGSPRSFLKSLEWAAETLTTVGYGAENSWDHPLMVYFVITVQFIGALLVFLVVPIALVPFLEQRFETKLPRTVPPMEDHLLIFYYGAPVTTLLTEAEKAGVATLIVEEDAGTARRLIERGHGVVVVPGPGRGIEAGHLLQARALIANGTDDQNAAIIVAARQAGFEGDIRRSGRRAGPPQTDDGCRCFGRVHAAPHSRRCAGRPGFRAHLAGHLGNQQLGRRLRTFEMRIESGSPIIGKTLAETAIGRETGATVLGQWVGGVLHGPLRPAIRLGGVECWSWPGVRRACRASRSCVRAADVSQVRRPT